MDASNFEIIVDVLGEPKAQPRARPVHKNGVTRVWTPGTAEEWKARILNAVKSQLPPAPTTSTIQIELRYMFSRPKSHYGTGRNRGRLRRSAPPAHTNKPDVDNLNKAVFDCLSGVVWKDDRQIIRSAACKVWMTNGYHGVTIRIVAREAGAEAPIWNICL